MKAETPDATPLEIPNRFDFAEQSEAIYARWEAAGCFNAEADSKKKSYTIVIPPPNVTGALHLGHALNNTLQDIQIRLHRMLGFEALWIPGTDHAGIATQAVVEKRLKEQEGKTRHDLGREALVARIWQWKDQYESRIIGQLKRLGASCDWRRKRFTLDEQCAKAVRTTFFDLFSKSLIYRGKRLVNWDTFLQTTVSDDEVFHEVVKGYFWHFKYPIVDPRPGEPAYVVIATTRPETMLGDSAVAVHPNPRQALEKTLATAREKLDAAGEKDRADIESQIKAIEERFTSHLPQLELLARMSKDQRKIALPLTDRIIPLVADVWAKPELGSGCVKITPAHDQNDYEVGKRCMLPMINILNVDGTLNENGGAYAGLSMPKARAKVVEAMEQLGLLVETEDRQIDLAHSDRSKTPIEPYLADQWFIEMATLAESAITAAESGAFAIRPERYLKTYVDWLSEKRDWPVGRQLWWGHQIPIWSRSFSDLGEAKSMVAKVERLGKDIVDSNKNLIRSQIESPEDGGSYFVHVCIRDDDRGLETVIESLGLVRQTDVLDTWFSSALWPHSTLGWPNKTEELGYFYPTDTLITSRDIITLWVARMVLMSLNNTGVIPFLDVYIHPKILDGSGETMSKSKGNGVDPIDVIDKFGPDALRFGLCWLATDTQDVRMPVQYECPHCETLLNQTKENRQKPVIRCDKCEKQFSTQWAESDADRALPKAAVVSERFEVARNFVNKLWNASRFVMLNLSQANAPLDASWKANIQTVASLPLEDRWILSRLDTVSKQVQESLTHFRFAEAARFAYQFAWDDFCSLYIEMAKPRLQNPSEQKTVLQVLHLTLDAMLRILHPFVPFVTEAIWNHLTEVIPNRSVLLKSPFIMLADYPHFDGDFHNQQIEAQFSHFTSLLGAIREIRSRQNLAPKDRIECTVCSTMEIEKMLMPMRPFLTSMAGATITQWDSDPQIPSINAHMPLEQMDVYVDLSKLIDVHAEILRNTKLLENLTKQILGKESKLSNVSFVARAPTEVVVKERESLAELVQQRVSTESALAKLMEMTN